MIIISHRGESKDFQENSMTALFKAYFDGANGVEMDVRKTKDNKLVLCHDNKVNRVSNSKGKISEMTYVELLNANFNGEKIVLLEDVFKYLGNKNILLLVEIKEKNIENIIIELVHQYNLNNIVLASFNLDVLRKIKEIDYNMKTAFLVYFINNRTIRNSILINTNIIACYSCFIEAEDILECHNNNILVYAWGIKNCKIINWLRMIDINGIIVDNFKEALNVTVQSDK